MNNDRQIRALSSSNLVTHTYLFASLTLLVDANVIIDDVLEEFELPREFIFSFWVAFDVAFSWLWLFLFNGPSLCRVVHARRLAHYAL